MPRKFFSKQNIILEITNGKFPDSFMGNVNTAAMMFQGINLHSQQRVNLWIYTIYHYALNWKNDPNHVLLIDA